MQSTDLLWYTLLQKDVLVMVEYLQAASLENAYVRGDEDAYVAVADEAFPLLKHVIRPYPGKNLSKERSIYYYRLSRVRRVVENAFGILAARWRAYYKPLEISVELVDKVAMATCVLHIKPSATIYMRFNTTTRYDYKYCPEKAAQMLFKCGIHLCRILTLCMVMYHGSGI
ncbi:hypothetical protein PR048_023351 [Dryococelus australis]|uniref:DDE Tnp4 domain-containing protein n=1 Tax=Dryococelus australis TaxID=614101 RepID=A0ABQ9GTU5_9NEOP|nr:hypothetical protein PR048_023351 [Dryococelus australis]